MNLLLQRLGMGGLHNFFVFAHRVARLNCALRPRWQRPLALGVCPLPMDQRAGRGAGAHEEERDWSGLPPLLP
jgi:hypothetical protein